MTASLWESLEDPFEFAVERTDGDALSLAVEGDDELDSDANFVAQVFAGFRAHFPSGVVAQAGARYIFRDDFQLLGDQFITEDSVAFEASIGFRF